MFYLFLFVQTLFFIGWSWCFDAIFHNEYFAKYSTTELCLASLYGMVALTPFIIITKNNRHQEVSFYPRPIWPWVFTNTSIDLPIFQRCKLVSVTSLFDILGTFLVSTDMRT